MVELGKKYGDVLERINKKGNEKKGSRTIELFFSFDIVNSSSYKDINYLEWPDVLTKLLTDIQKEITKDIPGAQLWRVLGDEIIFFVTIKDIEEIYTVVDAVYSVLVKSNIKLHNGKSNEEDGNFYKKSSILGVQAAAWIAIIAKEEKKFEMYDNIFKRYRINGVQQINEFLGQDIDTGFRIKKETQKRRLVLSLELAKILSDKTEYLSKLKIITYKKLKGIWNDRLYPIIWYHDETISGVEFEDSFYYDETTYSPLSKEYFLNREKDEGDLASYMFLNTRKALEKIIKDQNLENKMVRINEIIKDTSNDERNVETEFDNKLLEFHCAAVCCDVENKQVLIVKRKNRTFFSGLWEFGCAKANIEENLCDSVKKDYKNDFGIDIEIVCDESRKDKEPKPIALYQIDKAEKLQKGVIVVAKIVRGIENIQSVMDEKGKHEQFRWISKKDISNFNDDAINDFKNTLEKVFTMWDEFFKEE